MDPAPRPRDGASLRGASAGPVMRLLADVTPPYTATQVATTAGVSVPYMSRLLTALDREALVERGRRGVVDAVDWAGVLRRRAEDYQLFATAGRAVGPAEDGDGPSRRPTRSSVTRSRPGAF